VTSSAGTFTAERIKLSTTASPWWCAAVAAVLSLGVAALTALTVTGMYLTPEEVAIGLTTFGVPVLMILSALTITGEFRSGMIRTTFMATPNRTLVLAAKALITASFAAAFAAVTGIASIALAQALAERRVGPALSLALADSWRTVGAVALYAALTAVLAVSLGALLRHAAAVITILLLTPFVVEPLFGAMPRVGEQIGPFMPFSNAYAFTGVPWYRGAPLLWGPLGALVYFTGFVVVIFVTAAFVLNRRDP
jgi:ABC-2 type transport system permease protein